MQLLRKKGNFDSTRILFLPVDAIAPNPDQPRRVFAQQELDELAHSIQALGLLQPLTVRRSAQGGWELVAGERRLRAARLAGLQEVPCLSLQIDSQRASLLALVENLQRKDLDFWEEALALEKLISHLSPLPGGGGQAHRKEPVGGSQQAPPAEAARRGPGDPAGRWSHRAPRPCPAPPGGSFPAGPGRPGYPGRQAYRRPNRGAGPGAPPPP